MSQNGPAANGFDLAAIRAQFPTLERRVYDDKRLIFLDSAASSQKPLAVTDAMDQLSLIHISEPTRRRGSRMPSSA